MDLFDNKYIMDFDEALLLIKSFFVRELPFFALQDEYNKNSGYWGIRYLHNEHSVFISGDRGYLVIRMLLNGETVSLADFEPLMNELKVASEKNIRFTLTIINRYFKRNML